ncbi:hypothetical protein ACJMK2_019208, partial [Sinanodonta woodiana]
INECLLGSGPCENGGTCTDTFGSYVCTCPNGLTGPTCSIDVNECLQDVCRNGGTCRNTFGSYSCICPQGFTGLNCQQ